MKRTLLCLGAIAALAGCDDKETATYRVSKDPTEPAPKAAQSAPGPEVAGATGSSATEATGPATAFHAPTNWEAQPLTSMRMASFLVKGEAGALADVSLVILGGGAGNTLDNVNRWLGQLGKQAISAEQLAATSRKLTTALGDVTAVDLEGLPQGADAAKDGRILAAIAMRKDESWFFKMRGNASLVAAEKQHFLDWVRSATPATRSDAGPMQSASMPVDPTHAAAMQSQMPVDPTHAAAMQTGQMPVDPTHASAMQASSAPAGEPAQAKLRWEVPKDWKTAPSSGMRYASFTAEGANGDKADITVVRLSGQAGGDLDNVNRWRQQLGLGPVTPEELKSLVVRLGEDPSGISVVDLASNDHRMLAGWQRHGDETWFFKCVGSAALVNAEKEKFMGFLKSVKFETNASSGEKAN